MTIAACHVCPEGVVLGCDSTSTVTVNTGTLQEQHYYRDYEQKLFEIGEPESTVALVTWGSGRFGTISHRTMAARLGVRHANGEFAALKDMADRLAADVWQAMQSQFGPALAEARDLYAKWQQDPNSTTPEEWNRLIFLYNRYGGGYFLGGRFAVGEDCAAYEIVWNVLGTRVDVVPHEAPYFRGQSHIMERLIFGYDHLLADRIKASGKWTGTDDELANAMAPSHLIVRPELLPIRDAIDWIHTVIHTTIRAVKFAGQHVCGGPVELAVITTDRPFRWVCHKRLDAAIITAQEGPKTWSSPNQH